MTTNEMYNILVGIINIHEDVIACMTAIHGENEKTYNDILFWSTGYRNFEQLIEEENW